jgi:hypothetical protein
MSNYFDEVAKVWNTKDRKNRTFTIYEKMFKYLGENLKDKTALEIGSGDGLLATLLSKDLKRIDCIDTSLKMREESINRINEMKIENISINDEIFLENSNGKYDIIYSLTAFHHIVDVEAELKSLREHIRENGKIIIMDLDTVSPDFHKDFPNFDGHDGFSREEMENYFKRASFIPKNYEIVWNGRSKEGD